MLDRSNISAAYIAGLDEGVQLNVGARYTITLLVFFISYALFEVPSNWAIRRVGARWWLSFLAVSWGACVLGMGFIQRWEVLAVLIVLLGLFAAGIFPGAIFIISSWYRTFETAQRVSIFYMASMIAAGFGPIFAFALSLIRVGGPDSNYQQGWRWIFIIEGIATIVAGLLSPLFLIEFPEKATFLNERQKHIALTRVRLEKEAKVIKYSTFQERFIMLLDWKVGLYAFQYFVAGTSVYSLSFFQPVILRDGMGFSYAMAQLLKSPPYVFAIICSCISAYVSDKLRIRWPVMVSQAGVAVMGLLMVLYAVVPAARYVGLFLAIYGCQSDIPTSLAYGQNQTARPEKCGVVAAASISGGAIGGICGSTIFRSQDAPQYLPGMWTTIVLQILYCVVTFSLSTYFKRQNRLADEGRKPALEGVEGFRYAS